MYHNIVDAYRTCLEDIHSYVGDTQIDLFLHKCRGNLVNIMDT